MPLPFPPPPAPFRPAPARPCAWVRDYTPFSSFFTFVRVLSGAAYRNLPHGGHQVDGGNFTPVLLRFELKVLKFEQMVSFCLTPAGFLSFIILNFRRIAILLLPLFYPPAPPNTILPVLVRPPFWLRKRSP